MSATLPLGKKVRSLGALVAFSHTIFAMPFAAAAVVLSLKEPHLALTIPRVAAMLVCMVAARTSAMAFNRWADREIDAKNPRTQNRPLQTGALRAIDALLLTIVSAVVFLAAAASLGRTPAVLSPIVLAVLLGYSYAKRFTWAAHAWLGVALALAPGGAWIAMGAAPNAGIVALMVAVVTWLLGFDVLYSLQDETFDRATGLHSIPARFGMTGALVLSALAHVVTVAALAFSGIALGRGTVFFVAVAAVGALLVWEHAIVGKGNLARIDKAFFDVNAYVSMSFFALVVVDELLRRRLPEVLP
jgi:4-hydroxybenzoate polyprenyltransferase